MKISEQLLEFYKGSQTEEGAFFPLEVLSKIQFLENENEFLKVKIQNQEYDLEAQHQYVKELEADNTALKGDLEAIR